MKEIETNNHNKSGFNTGKRIRLVYIPTNTVRWFNSIAETSRFTGVSPKIIAKNLNWDDKEINGFKFYDYG